MIPKGQIWCHWDEPNNTAIRRPIGINKIKNGTARSSFFVKKNTTRNIIKITTLKTIFWKYLLYFCNFFSFIIGEKISIDVKIGHIQPQYTLPIKGVINSPAKRINNQTSILLMLHKVKIKIKKKILIILLRLFFNLVSTSDILEWAVTQHWLKKSLILIKPNLFRWSFDSTWT